MLNTFSIPEEIYHAQKNMLAAVNGLKESVMEHIVESKADSRLYEEYCSLKDKKIHFTHPGKSDYPAQLNDIYDKPYALYYKGMLPEKDRPVVSIIGARGCTEYGRTIAENFGRVFTDMGIQVISGMALGIDAAGHRGALQAGGYTLGVLGCGVDVCYPRENIGLYTEILDRGGILSEYPPGTAPNAGQFPMRNRIISGLSDVVVVVEARNKSGSLITVDQALEQNKDIMAVPGRITDPLSEGCNRLIQMGAQMIIEPEDLLSNSKIADICNTFQKKKEKKKNAENCHENVEPVGKQLKNFRNSGLASEKNMLYSCLNLYPKSMNIIIEETNMTIPQVSRMLLELELEGLIKEVSKGNYVRVHL